VAHCLEHADISDIIAGRPVRSPGSSSSSSSSGFGTAFTNLRTFDEAVAGLS
jgi:hypothetical protein